MLLYIHFEVKIHNTQQSLQLYSVNKKILRLAQRLQTHLTVYQLKFCHKPDTHLYTYLTWYLWHTFPQKFHSILSFLHRKFSVAQGKISNFLDYCLSHHPTLADMFTQCNKNCHSAWNVIIYPSTSFKFHLHLCFSDDFQLILEQELHATWDK